MTDEPYHGLTTQLRVDRLDEQMRVRITTEKEFTKRIKIIEQWTIALVCVAISAAGYLFWHWISAI